MNKYSLKAFFVDVMAISSYESYRYFKSKNLESAIIHVKENYNEMFKDDDNLEVGYIAEVKVKRSGRKYKWHRVHGNLKEELEYLIKSEEEFTEWLESERKKENIVQI